MLRIFAVSALGLALMSGCATTQNVVSQLTPSHTPLSQVLKLRPELQKDLATVEIRQFFNRVENPSIGQVKVTETGLMDDSVKSIQTIYHFNLDNDQWQLNKTDESYKCARGKNTKTFQKVKCP